MTSEKAILAGGCFWGMEELFRQLPGVLGTKVGYTGGYLVNPTYNDIGSGETGHAEAIEVEFNPAQTSFDAILAFFFQIHDPTTSDRQGNDRGSQYRSAIFYTNEAQRDAAMRVITAIDKSGRWPGPVVTQVKEAGPFYLAEIYHQDYLQKNPGGYTCHWVRADWRV